MLFRLCETFFRNFLNVSKGSPSIFSTFQQNGGSKNSKGSPLLHFSALCDVRGLQKNSKKFFRFFSVLLDFFSQIFLNSPKGPLNSFFLFCKIMDVRHFLHFSALCDLPETKKILKKKFGKLFPDSGTVEENT